MTRSLGYRPRFDGLRGVAIALVVAYHGAYRFFPGGFLGVDVFFVLSGFLITTLLLGEWDATGSISVIRFWGRRIVRLVPALAVLLAVTGAAVAAVHGIADLRGGAWDIVESLTDRHDWGLVLTLGYARNLDHLWSLTVEERFYLLWPVVLVVLLRARLPRVAIVAVTAGALLASAGFRAALWSSGKGFAPLYAGFGTRADGILVGCLVAELWAWGHLPRRLPARVVQGGALVGAAVFATALVTFDGARGVQRFLAMGGFTATAAAAGLLLLAALDEGCPSWLARALEWRPLVGLGRISYGVFLWNYPIFGLLRDGRPTAESLWSAPVGAALSVAVAWVSWRLVEQPALRLKRRLRRPGAPSPQGPLADAVG